MAYTVFDATKPDPTVDDGTDGYNNARTNLTALRDAIVMGQMQGFLFSKTDGTGTAAHECSMKPRASPRHRSACARYCATGSKAK